MGYSPTKLKLKPVVASLLFVITNFSFTTYGQNKTGFLSGFEGYFVENKNGQSQVHENEPFVSYIHNIKIIFSNQGMELTFTGKKKQKGEESEQGHQIETITKSTRIEFENASEQMSLSAVSERKNYFISHGNVKSRCYDTLIYKNVWPNIDLVYFFPKQGGIKYNIILHEGANIKDVAFKYPNTKIDQTPDGVTLLQSEMGIIRNYPPITFNAKNEIIESVDYVEEGLLKFDIKKFNSNKTYVIDPWIEVLPPLTSYDSLPSPYDSLWFFIGSQLVGTGITNAFNRNQIDYDAKGNIYVSRIPGLEYSGGISGPDYYAVGHFLHKYDPNGSLIFSVDLMDEYTFTTDISVNRVTKEIYSNRNFDEFEFFDSTGVLVQTIEIESITNGPTELNSLEYNHCSDSIVFGFGGSFDAPYPFIGAASGTSPTAISFHTHNLSGSSASAYPYNDNVDLFIDPYQNSYYFLFMLRNLGFIEPSSLVKMNPNMATTYQVDGPFLPTTELRMHSSGPVLGIGRNHFNSLVCSQNFLYGFNGSDLIRFNKSTGAILQTVPTGLLLQRTEGIDVDMCGKVYIGAVNSIRVYDPLLTLIATIPVDDITQDIHVYGNKIYMAQDYGIEMVDLPPSVDPWSIASTPDSCNLCAGTATISLCSGNLPSNVSVLWESTGDVSLTTTGLCAGWQRVFITEVKNCVDITYVDSVFIQTTVNAICPLSVSFPEVTICSGDCVQLNPIITGNIVGPLVYNWSPGGLNSATISVCTDTSVTYGLTITDSVGNFSSATVTINTVIPPIVDLGNDTTLCAGEELTLDAGNPGLTYLWQDGSIDQTFTVTAGDTYSVSVEDNGCIVSDTITVTYYLLTVDLGPDTLICGGTLNVILDADNLGLNYLWQDGSTQQTYNVAIPGSYSVTVSDQFCSAYDEVNIAAENINSLFFVSDTIGCSPQDVDFTDLSTSDSGISAWLWNFGDGNTSTLQNPSHTYALNGSYNVSLIVTSSLGCTSVSQRTITIEIYATPIASFTYSPDSPNALEEVVFKDNSMNAFSWDWSFGDGANSTDQNPVHIYTERGTYQVVLVVNNNECIDSTFGQIVIVEELIFYVPNAFTPDGNEFNNGFLPIFVSGFDPDNYHLTIYNRWGEIVFESYDSAIGWDGSYDDSTPVQDGMFVWQIEFGDINNDKKYTYQGHVTVLK